MNWKIYFLLVIDGVVNICLDGYLYKININDLINEYLDLRYFF